MKNTNQWGFNNLYQLMSEHYHCPREKPGTCQLFSISLSWEPLTTTNLLSVFLSLQICLFWAFYTHGIMQYMAFGVWPLLLSVMFSRFTQVVAYISASLPFKKFNKLQFQRSFRLTAKLYSGFSYTCFHTCSLSCLGLSNIHLCNDVHFGFLFITEWISTLFTLLGF